MTRYKIGAISAILFFGILASPVFHFTEIKVTGNSKISTEEIVQRSGLDSPVNLFLFRPSRARRDIMANHYIDHVRFDRSLPGSIEITVYERFLSGFVEYIGGMFLYICENGRVLEVRSYMAEDLPIIMGLQFSHVHLGEPLMVDNVDAFGTVTALAQLLNRNGLMETISWIDVSDPANTRLRLYNIEVYLGDIRGSHEKISTLREIVNEWPVVRDARGFLDLRELDSEYIFRNLT